MLLEVYIEQSYDAKCWVYFKDDWTSFENI